MAFQIKYAEAKKGVGYIMMFTTFQQVGTYL